MKGGGASVSSIAHVEAAPENPFSYRMKEGVCMSLPESFLLPYSVLNKVSFSVSKENTHM